MNMKVGILGGGNIAHKMAKTISKMDGVELYGIAARDRDRAKAFVDAYGVKKSYSSYEAMLEDPEIDLVYIATILPYHAEHMKLCLNYGKPVICEKPFTINASQAKDVLDLGSKKNLLVAEAIWTRYLPMRKVMDDILASGIIGKPISLSANLGEPVSHYPRITQPELCGGAFMDMGIYTVNFALMNFGSTIAKIDSTMIPYETGVDAMSTITFTYDDQRIAMLHSTMLARTDKRGMVFGAKGYIEFVNINNCEGINVFNADNEPIASYATPPQISGFEYEIEACKISLEAGRIECPEMPHAEILKVMNIMDKVRGIWGLKYPME
jgi:predicted dehydrogenase